MTWTRCLSWKWRFNNFLTQSKCLYMTATIISWIASLLQIFFSLAADVHLC